MKIILATGIYPPAIGGPATYAHNLAKELARLGHDVEVITYASELRVTSYELRVHRVSRSIPILRWWWYSQKLREVSQDADVVYAFSSISCGIPIVLSGLRCKRVLRLGGDFFWERYTDWGGRKGLQEWYISSHWSLVIGHWFIKRILNRFDHIVFSTDFQKDIYKDAYKKLPPFSVIENALAMEQVVPMQHHHISDPFRLLFVGRFVPFKNIASLIEAVAQIPGAYLTIVGDGPLDDALRRLVEKLGLDTRIRFVAPVHGKEKYEMFDSHDLLVLPSFTDISPNTALEARSVGLPVLITDQNGLSHHLRRGMHVADLSSVGNIIIEISRCRDGYSLLAEAASKKLDGRSWEEIADETLVVVNNLVSGKN